MIDWWLEFVCVCVCVVKLLKCYSAAPAGDDNRISTQMTDKPPTPTPQLPPRCRSLSTMQIFLFYCVIEACQTIRLLPPWNLKGRRQRYAKEWQQLNNYNKQGGSQSFWAVVVQRATDARVSVV